jgi:hypothetical protein
LQAALAGSPQPKIEGYKAMLVEKFWSVSLQNGIIGGLEPSKDPFDNTVFYIGDGWGSTYPSMKFRKLSIETGRESANYAVKNTVRCCYINSDNIFVASDKKIFQLNRKDLAVQKIFAKNIPRYTDYINSDDAGSLLLMNHGGNFIYNYNCGQEQATKTKIKSCAGIIKSGADDFTIFSPYEGVYNYNLPQKAINKLLAMEPYYKCALSKSGELLVHCGEVIEKTYNTHKHIEPSTKIRIYKSIKEDDYLEIDTQTCFRNFIFSEPENSLYLINKNILSLYSLTNKKVVDEYRFEEGMIISHIFIEEKIIFSYKFQEANTLMSWKYNA